jgi:hypothetical protein
MGSFEKYNNLLMPHYTSKDTQVSNQGDHYTFQGHRTVRTHHVDSLPVGYVHTGRTTPSQAG